jgi:hypothetical protein
MLTCDWQGNGGCDSRALEVIVFGCLNQHIKDLPLCHRHAGDWVKTCEQGMICSDCYTPIDYSWVMIQTYRLNKDYEPTPHIERNQ